MNERNMLNCYYLLVVAMMSKCQKLMNKTQKKNCIFIWLYKMIKCSKYICINQYIRGSSKKKKKIQKYLKLSVFWLSELYQIKFSIVSCEINSKACFVFNLRNQIEIVSHPNQFGFSLPRHQWQHRWYVLR